LGADKYGPWNWRETGVCASTYVNAILRHLNAWRDGESLDPESGITHLAHIACSANILMDAEYCGKLQDDRNKRPTKDETEDGSPKVGSSLEDMWRELDEEDDLAEFVEDMWRELDEDTAPVYHILKEGESIQEGDEYYYLVYKEWVKASGKNKKVGAEQLYRRKVKVADCDLEEDTVPEYHVRLREGDKLQDGDEVYVGEDHWLPVYVSDWMTPAIVNGGTYRRKITNCDLKPESSIDDECKCGRRKVYHWLYGYICEDCDIKYPDPQP
jgi:hypothetical protein